MRNGCEMDPLVSIIIPVYNFKDELPRCVESVLNQTYHNLEVILVDDGSTDGSGALCDQYAVLDKRVHVIHKENGGVSSARNCGLEFAHGEYISLLDSDDYFDLDMIEYLLGLLLKTGADYSKCPARLVNWPLAVPQEASEDDYQVYSKEDAVKNTLIGRFGFTGSACHNVYKKCILKDILFYPARSNEDLDFITRVAINAGDVVVTQCSKYNYVFHPDGGHATPLSQYMNELDQVYSRLGGVIKEKMPEMMSFLDVRYFRNALDALHNHVQSSKSSFDDNTVLIAKKLKKMKVSGEYLNKSEKMLRISLHFGLSVFRKIGKLLDHYKERRKNSHE